MGLRPRFTTPLTRVRDSFARYLVRPLKVLPPRARLFVGFVILVLITTLLLVSGYSSSFAEEYKEGDVVRRTVVAPADINTIDVVETERRRNVAREHTAPYLILIPHARPAPPRFSCSLGRSQTTS